MKKNLFPDIFRGRKVKPYFKTPTLLFSRRAELGLTSSEILAIIGILYYHPNHSPPEAAIGGAVGVSRSTICRAVKSLADKGFLKIGKRPLRGKLFVNTYDLGPLFDRLTEKFELPEPPPAQVEEESDELTPEEEALFTNFFGKTELPEPPPPKKDEATLIAGMVKNLTRHYPIWRARRDFDLEVQLREAVEKARELGSVDPFKHAEKQIEQKIKGYAISVGWDHMKFLSDLGDAYSIHTESNPEDTFEEFKQGVLDGRYTYEGIS